MAGYTMAEHEAWLNMTEELPDPSLPKYWALAQTESSRNNSSRIGERILFIAMILLRQD